MPIEPSKTRADLALKPLESHLTRKQELFCREYMIDLNATQAAIRAGYSKQTAKQQGARLLTNVDIQQFCSELVNERTNGLNMNADKVLRGLSAIARNGKTDSAKIRALELLGKYFNLWDGRFNTPNENKGGRVVFYNPEKGR